MTTGANPQEGVSPESRTGANVEVNRQRTWPVTDLVAKPCSLFSGPVTLTAGPEKREREILPQATENEREEWQ